MNTWSWISSLIYVALGILAIVAGWLQIHSYFQAHPNPKLQKLSLKIAFCVFVGIIIVSVILNPIVININNLSAQTNANTPQRPPNSGTIQINQKTPSVGINTKVTMGITPLPTPSPTPSPTPTPLPKPGTILYQEDGSDGWQGWALSSGWKVVNDTNTNTALLVSDGNSDYATPSAVPPYSLPQGIQNFAVEAKITVFPSAGFANFGISACGPLTNTSGYTGQISYSMTIDGQNIKAQVATNQGSLSISDFNPGQQPHTYRLEVRGNDIKLVIDGGLIAHGTDNQFLSCGSQVGIINSKNVIHVNSFEVIAL